MDSKKNSKPKILDVKRVVMLLRMFDFNERYRLRGIYCSIHEGDAITLDIVLKDTKIYGGGILGQIDLFKGALAQHYALFRENDIEIKSHHDYVVIHKIPTGKEDIDIFGILSVAVDIFNVQNIIWWSLR